MAYGERIRRYREALGLTQDELAKYADIPSTSISRIEHGTRKVTLDEAVRIAEILRIDLTELAGVVPVNADLAGVRQRVAKLGEKLQRMQSEMEAVSLELSAV